MVGIYFGHIFGPFVPSTPIFDQVVWLGLRSWVSWNPAISNMFHASIISNVKSPVSIYVSFFVVFACFFPYFPGTMVTMGPSKAWPMPSRCRTAPVLHWAFRFPGDHQQHSICAGPERRGPSGWETGLLKLFFWGAMMCHDMFLTLPRHVFNARFSQVSTCFLFLGGSRIGHARVNSCPCIW